MGIQFDSTYAECPHGRILLRQLPQHRAVHADPRRLYVRSLRFRRQGRRRLFAVLVFPPGRKWGQHLECGRQILGIRACGRYRRKRIRIWAGGSGGGRRLRAYDAICLGYRCRQHECRRRFRISGGRAVPYGKRAFRHLHGHVRHDAQLPGFLPGWRTCNDQPNVHLRVRRRQGRRPT